MKRFLCLLAVTIVLLGALAACGENEPSASSNTPEQDTTTTTTTTTAVSTTSSATATENSTTTTTTTVRPQSSTTATTTTAMTTTTTTTVTTTTKSPYKPKPAAAQTLANTQYLLTQKKAFNVAYYGGSITQGTGATKAEETSWRALTTAWLKGAYPDATVTEINAARGGTGTYFGKMRADFELLNYDPDLTFIEFVVNDNIEHKTLAQSKENLEIIIRKCYQKNPNMDIVFIYTCTAGSKSNNDYTKAFDEVAKHYGLNIINVGAALEKADGKLTDYFTADMTHPNDAGYKVMADEVVKQMKTLLGKAGNPVKLAAHQNPQTLKEDLSLGVKAYTVDDILAQNPTLGRKAPNDYCSVDSALLSNGDTVTFTFKGTSVGVWWRCFDRATILMTCRLDGKEIVAKKLTMGTHYSYELFQNLENTEHTLTFTYTGWTVLYLPYIFITN